MTKEEKELFGFDDENDSEDEYDDSEDEYIDYDDLFLGDEEDDDEE